MRIAIAAADLVEDRADLHVLAGASRLTFFGITGSSAADPRTATEHRRQSGKAPRLRVSTGKPSDDMKGFVALRRRWVVERTSSSFGRNRHLSKDFEPCRSPLPHSLPLPPSSCP
jgi:hypothetical protein